MDGTSQQSADAPIPDLNTGMLVDPSTGQYVGGSADLGTGLANVVVAIENAGPWVLIGIGVVGALLLRQLFR